MHKLACLGELLEKVYRVDSQIFIKKDRKDLDLLISEAHRKAIFAIRTAL